MLELLACVGLHWIIKYGTIFDKPRNLIKMVGVLRELLNCSLCLGFWCGVVVGALVNNIIMYSFASAACCWFADNLNNTLQSVEIKLDK